MQNIVSFSTPEEREMHKARLEFLRKKTLWSWEAYRAAYLRAEEARDARSHA